MAMTLARALAQSKPERLEIISPLGISRDSTLAGVSPGFYEIASRRAMAPKPQMTFR
jgi:hypothetical protein